MSETSQTIIILVIAVVAIGYLVRKFIWNPKKKNASKSCGNDGCGC